MKMTEQTFVDLFILNFAWSIAPAVGPIGRKATGQRVTKAMVYAGLCLERQVERLRTSYRVQGHLLRQLEQQVKVTDDAEAQALIEQSTKPLFAWMDAVRTTPRSEFFNRKELYLTPAGEEHATVLEEKYTGIITRDIFLSRVDPTKVRLSSATVRQRIVLLFLPKDWTMGEVVKRDVWQKPAEAGRDASKQPWRDGQGFLRRQTIWWWSGVGRYVSMTERHLETWRRELEAVRGIAPFGYQPVLFIQDEGAEMGHVLENDSGSE